MEYKKGFDQYNKYLHYFCICLCIILTKLAFKICIDEDTTINHVHKIEYSHYPLKIEVK